MRYTSCIDASTVIYYVKQIPPKGSIEMKKWWKIPVIGIAAVLTVALSYVAYVFITYSRIEDNVELSVYGEADKAASTDTEYTIVSYNAGFGAYTADFTFFMDEGKESRAYSEESVKTCINGISDIALSYSPDIALFQEVDYDSTRSHHVDEVQMIKDSFSAKDSYDNVFAQNYHSAYLMYPITKPHGASNSGLLTESRFNISSSLRRSIAFTSSSAKKT